MRILFIGVLFLLLACSTEKPQQVDGPLQPNVLFILADDLGYNDISCMGSKFYETPNIDRIAEGGVTFLNGYAACQVCSPSRASIMNGKFPSRHGITDWIGAGAGENWRKAKRYTRLLPPEYNRHLDHDEIVMPEAFADEGYKTFFAGKWHLGNEGSYPQDHGFQINEGGYERGGPYSGGFFSPFHNPQMEDHPDEVGMSLPQKLAKETCEFMTQSASDPFFAYLSFYAVHAPIQTTQSNWKKYRQKAADRGINEKGFEMERRLPYRLHQDNPVYAGLIEHMDDAVGTVLDKLEELGIADHTIVIFTSDNGGVVSGDNFSTNLSPLRGGKGYQWEGGIKVPYLVRVPWLGQAGVQRTDRVSSIDFYPTLAHLAGVPLPDNQQVDGVSVVDVLKGEPVLERPLIWHYPHYGNQGGDPSSVLIEGDMKLIYYWEDAHVELYDLSEDIGERKDLAGDRPAEVEALSTKLMEALEEHQANRPVPDPKYSQDSFDLRQQHFETTVLERVERQRREMLSPSYLPNEDWWGSQEKE
ncbi:MAG: sulfatase [Saprospiraceae bacterium]|nr:sulfatase [Saprospiraceae bacterium]